MAIWAALIPALASVAGAGLASSLQKTPETPDYGALQREGIETDIATLPRRKEIEALSRTGGELLKKGYTKKSVADGQEDINSQLAKYQAELAETKAFLDRGVPVYQGSVFEKPSAKTSAINKIGQEAYDKAQSKYADLNNKISLLQNTIASGGETTAYFDPQGNPVSRAEALEQDFTGISDIDQSLAVARAQLAFQPEEAQAQLDLSRQFGSQFIEEQLRLLQEADPVGFQIREEMGQKILSEGFGTNLSPSQRGEVQQATRSAQAARGNIFGAAPAAVEAMQTGDAGFRLQQQRLANASAFLSGATPQAQFGQLSNAGQSVVPQNSFGLVSGVGLNQNAGAQSAAFGANVFGQQSVNAATQNAQNPWGALLGNVSQYGLNLAYQNAFNPGVVGYNNQTYVPAQGSAGTYYTRADGGGF